MSTTAGQKRKTAGENTGQRKKFIRSKKQQRAAAAAYHSSSEDESEVEVGLPQSNGDSPLNDVELSSADEENDSGVELPNLVLEQRNIHRSGDVDGDEAEEEMESEEEAGTNDDEEEDDDDDQATNSDSNSESQSAVSDPRSSDAPHKLRKRNDPTQFATSISKILSSKLTSSQRPDPVLSRSKVASKASKELNENRLEAKAKRKLRDDKRAALERARDKDVKGFSRNDGTTGEIIEKETQLRRTAQRGVVKLFNAVRAAQVKGEEAAREARLKGVVGVDQQQEQVNEMSKKGFLDLLVEGGR